jgi:hypothetical protein
MGRPERSPLSQIIFGYKIGIKNSQIQPEVYSGNHLIGEGNTKLHVYCDKYHNLSHLFIISPVIYTFQLVAIKKMHINVI